MTGGAWRITEREYLRIQPKLFAKILGFGIPREDAEELVQEAFMEAQKGLDEGKFEGRSRLDTWVVSIGKNLCLRHLRSKRALKRSAVEISIEAPSPTYESQGLRLEDQGPLPDRIVADRELLEEVYRRLASLSPKFRDPLLLKAQGYSYKQIAGILGSTPSQVSSRIHQARVKLTQGPPVDKGVTSG